MKTMKEIAEEFAFKTNKTNSYNPEDSFWTYFELISGWINGNDNDYFHVTFCERKDIKRISISNTTDNPKKIAKIIKEIEPKAKVTYYQTETIQKEITI